MQSGKKLKVVLDTNTILSALLCREGNPAQVLVKAGSGEIINHISKDILKEVKEVLSRPKIVERTTDHERRYLIHFIESTSVLVTPKKKLNVITEDAADNKILECAKEAKAGYIISGDRHLLKLNEYEEIKIVPSSEFLKRFDTD